MKINRIRPVDKNSVPLAAAGLVRTLNEAIQRCGPIKFSDYNSVKFKPKTFNGLDDLDVVTNADGVMTTKSLLTTISMHLTDGKLRLAMEVEEDDTITGFSWVASD